MSVAELPLDVAAADANKIVKQKMTICYPFAGDTVGGSHFSLRGLLENLDPARYHILLIPEVPDGNIAEFFSAFEQAADPARPKRAFTPGEKFSVSKFFRTLAGLRARIRILRELDVDIVHTNDGRTHANWALAAHLAGVPLIWHHRADPEALGLRFVAPLVASRVLTVSNFSLPKGRIWSAGPKSQVVYSPFDTTIEADREKARQRILKLANIPEDALVLGYFGSFISRKRPFLFVDVVARLRKRLDRPVFGLMFGEAIEPEMYMQLKEHIRRNANDEEVRLMGFQSPGYEWISGCDQLIVPAVGEPLGRTLVEAMLVGTPVVATRSGGNAEALADGTGVLVDAESVDSLADGVVSVLANPNRTRQMIERAQNSARERFSKETHATAVMRVYEELISRSG